MTDEELRKLAKETADRAYSGMAQTVTNNGDWASALCIGQEIILTAMQSVRNAALDEAVRIVKNHYGYINGDKTIINEIRKLKDGVKP